MVHVNRYSALSKIQITKNNAQEFKMFILMFTFGRYLALFEYLKWRLQYGSQT